MKKSTDQTISSKNTIYFSINIDKMMHKLPETWKRKKNKGGEKGETTNVQPYRGQLGNYT